MRCYCRCFALAPRWAIIGSGGSYGGGVRNASAGVAVTDAVNAVTSEVTRGSDIVDGGNDEEETCSASAGSAASVAVTAAEAVGSPC